MIRERFRKWLKAASGDGVEMWFLGLALSGFAATISWANVFARANRDEDPKEDWMTSSSTAVFISFWVLTAGARVRQTEALRGAAVEMRGAVNKAAEQAKLRDKRAAERDRQAAEQQDRMLRFTKWLVAFAVLTLAATIIAAVR